MVAGPAARRRHDRAPLGAPTRHPTERWLNLARPILTSVSVVSACAALATVASLDEARGISAVQSTAIIAVLGLGVAARILANQIRSTQAHAEARHALADKERALSDADLALEHVRESNETIRQSEEHLRLVFEAAVDGIVELDHRDVILRTNEAFCDMVGIDRASIEGLPWTALAASVTEPDASFASLLTTGQGNDPAVGGPAALPGVAHLRRAHDAPATHPAGARRHRRAGSPTRRSVRSSSSCRTGTRTGRGCCGGPTAPSRRSATASRATSTTDPCRAYRRRRSPSKPRS